MLRNCYTRVIIMLGFFVFLTSITGCGSKQESQENIEKAVTEKPESIEGKIIGEKSVNGYDLQLICQSEEEITDERSPYYKLYKGIYILISRKEEKVVSKMELSFFDGESQLYFPKMITMNTEDYNGDGLEDFSLGQYVSSTAKQYQFYTVLKNGMVKQLSIEGDVSDAITASDKDYSPVFACQNQYISFQEYQQESGKTIDRKAKLCAVDKVKKDSGIYFAKIDKKEIGMVYNPSASYACSLLSYGDSVYTSSDRWEWKNKGDRKTFCGKSLGKEIGKIYDNHHLCWSMGRGALHEITGTGTLYQVKGYHDKYRVCVLYEDKLDEEDSNQTLYIAETFDCLNDIYLHYGKELYRDRLQFDSFHNASDETEGRKWTEEEIRSFREKLYQGKFVSMDDTDIDRIQEKGRTVRFTDDREQSIELIILGDESVAYQRGAEWYIVKL